MIRDEFGSEPPLDPQVELKAQLPAEVMTMRALHSLAPVFILFCCAPSHAAAQGYPGYPYTIMAPEGGAHHRIAPKPMTGRTWSAQPRRPVRSRRHGRIAVARGSPGVVLPTPLPRTPLIRPEGGGGPAVRIAPQEQGPTVVPGLANPVPNLPHGTESFQDRASRCAFQQGLYNVPGNARTQYMGACVQ